MRLLLIFFHTFSIIPPSLNTDYDKDYVVPEAAVSRDFGHSEDAKGEEVVDECVDEGVSERGPGKMLHGLEPVVHEYLRRHCDEAKHFRGGR